MRRLSLALALPIVFTAVPAAADESFALDVHRWRVIDSQSGPDNYYGVVEDPDGAFIRAAYRPPMETTVLGYELADEVLESARRVRWSWRATVLPRAGATCSNAADAAATVYVAWKRRLRWYVLKYVWAAALPKGSACERRRNLFVAQDSVVLETGAAAGVWATEEIDLRAEFRRHFADGDPSADVPDFKGVAIMTDGDDTESTSGADYARFVLIR